MGDVVDPETLLEWLSVGQGDGEYGQFFIEVTINLVKSCNFQHLISFVTEMQLIALEQLCMLLLMSDNVDRCFEW